MSTPYVCEQCALWKPRELVTFPDVATAEEHVERYHANRLLAEYRGTIECVDEEFYGEREKSLRRMLVDCRAEEKAYAREIFVDES